MAANEVVIKVSTLTKDAEKGVARVGRSFADLKKPILAVSASLGALAAGGFLLGRSLISTAVSAGMASNAFWRWEDATFVLKRNMGELLIKTLSPLLDKLAGLVERINKANPRLLKFAVIAALIATAVAAVGAPILALLVILPAVVAGVGLVAAAFGGLSIAMGPITLIVLGLAAAIAVGLFVWRNWETIMEGLRGSLGALDQTLGGLLSRMGLLSSETEEAGKSSVKSASIFALAFGAPGIIIKAFFKALSDPEGKGAEGEEALDSFKKKLADLTGKVYEVIIKPIFRGITGAGGAEGHGEQLGIGQGLSQLLDKIFPRQEVLQQRLEEGSAILNEAGNAYIAMPMQVEEQTAPIWERIWGKIKTGFTKVKDSIINTLNLIKIAFMARWNRIKNWFIETGWPAFKTFWSNAWTGVKDFVVTLWGDIKTKLGEIWGGIETLATEVFGRVQTFIEGVWSTVKGIVDSILAAVQRAKDALGDLSRGKIPGSAVGGPASGLRMVGEHGRELVNLPPNSNVIPHSQVDGVLRRNGGGAGLTINVAITGPTYGFFDLQDQVLKIIGDAFDTGGFRQYGF